MSTERVNVNLKRFATIIFLLYNYIYILCYTVMVTDIVITWRLTKSECGIITWRGELALYQYKRIRTMHVMYSGHKTDNLILTMTSP